MGGERTHLLLDLVMYLAIDHASLSRRGTVPTNRNASNTWALITLLSCSQEGGVL